MSRLGPLTPGDLTPEQDEVHRAIAGGPRAGGEQLFELKGADGSLNGPFGAMVRAPGVGMALQELGTAIRYRTSMTDRGREIAILMVAVANGSDFEWYAHSRIALSVGITEVELESLRDGSFTSPDPAEDCIAKLARALLEGERLDDDKYTEIVVTLGEAQTIEVTTLVGYYRTLAQLMDVFAVKTPDVS